MKKLGFLVLTLALPSLATSTCAYDSCQAREPRQATVDAAGASIVQVDAKAGSLRITGEEGLTEVRARGEACAVNRHSLEKVELRAERSGEEVHLEVVMPERWGERGALDLEVRVPANLAVAVKDTSGEVNVDGVASLRLEDRSDAIHVTDVGGRVWIHDGSGEIDVVDVQGSVTLEDGSGGIDVEDVRGSVTVERDGSGAIDIRGVRKDVLVRRDGSGHIRVEDVGGNFTVEEDGSGGISHARVQGRVQIPED